MLDHGTSCRIQRYKKNSCCMCWPDVLFPRCNRTRFPPNLSIARNLSLQWWDNQTTGTWNHRHYGQPYLSTHFCMIDDRYGMFLHFPIILCIAIPISYTQDPEILPLTVPIKPKFKTILSIFILTPLSLLYSKKDRCAYSIHLLFKHRLSIFTPIR